MGGSFKQLQHKKSAGDDWKDVEVGYYPNIYIKNKVFLYGDNYFRARTLAEEKFAKAKKIQQSMKLLHGQNHYVQSTVY